MEFTYISNVIIIILPFSLLVAPYEKLVRQPLVSIKLITCTCMKNRCAVLHSWKKPITTGMSIKVGWRLILPTYRKLTMLKMP